jgi:hypothetical protein
LKLFSTAGPDTLKALQTSPQTYKLHVWFFVIYFPYLVYWLGGLGNPVDGGTRAATPPLLLPSLPEGCCNMEKENFHIGVFSNIELS